MLNEKILKEECLYCHTNLAPEEACPFCGEVNPSVAKKSESLAPPEPEFFSGNLLELLIR